MSSDPDPVQMLAPVDPERAACQHDGLSASYREAGVEVHLVEPALAPPPNLLFVADLLFMTPEGAILARPASTVRAGEERILAARIAALGVPILRSIRGSGTFEGADAAWIGPRDVLLGRGPRTNAEGAAQVAAILSETGVRVHMTDLHPDTMHLMGQLRFLASDLVLSWKQRMDPGAIALLESSGFEVLDIPSEDEAISGFALNLVTLGPRSVLMASGNPVTRSFLDARGVVCREVQVDELARAAGGIACMTGILERTHTAGG